MSTYKVYYTYFPGYDTTGYPLSGAAYIDGIPISQFSSEEWGGGVNNANASTVGAFLVELQRLAKESNIPCPNMLGITAALAAGKIPTKDGYTYKRMVLYNNTTLSVFAQQTKPTTVTLNSPMPSNNCIIAFEWENSSKRTIRFDKNGASNITNMADVQLPVSTPEYKLPQCTYTPPNGATFAGWGYTPTTLPNKAMKPGTTITFNTAEVKPSVTVLYAIWSVTVTPPSPTPPSGGGGTTPTVVFVEFNGNGGNVNGGSGVSKSYNITSSTQTFGYDFPTATRSGYTFLGWFTSATGGTQVTGSSVIQNYANTTLYAHWQGTAKPRYTITFHRNDGSGATVSSSYEEGTVISGNQLPQLSRVGYDLEGWSLSPTGGTKYTSIRVSANATYYASWKPIKLTLVFNANGGSVSPTTKTVEYDSPFGSLPVPRKEPYVFKGWYSATYGGSLYTESTIAKGTVPINLYAQWSNPSLNPPSMNVPSKAKRKTQFTVRVNPVYGSGNGNATPTHYDIQRNINGMGWYDFGRVTQGSPYKTDQIDTFDYVMYRARSVYVDNSTRSEYTSAWCNAGTVYVDAGSPPGKPTFLYITPKGGQSGDTIYPNGKVNSYTVSWGPASGDDPDKDLAGYRLQYRYTTNGTTWTNWTEAGMFKKDVAREIEKLNSTIASGTQQIMYRVAAYDEFFNESASRYPDNISPWVERSAVVAWYHPPTTPPWIKVPDPESTTITAGPDKAFKISWGASTDQDNDIVSYDIERAYNGEAYSGDTRNVKADAGLYIFESYTPHVTKVRYRVRAVDEQGLVSGWRESPWRTVSYNTAPTAPAYIWATEPVKGGEYLRITWGESTDAENNLAGYELQRTLDGGVWTTIVERETRTIYDKYVVPRTASENHDTVAFRVRAVDALGLTSTWTYSKQYNVSNNSSPTVVTPYLTGSYLGQKTEGFAFGYSVLDPENDKVDIEVLIDGKRKSIEYNKTTPCTGTFSLSSYEFMSLSIGMHEIEITAKDAAGFGTWIGTFFRKGDHAFITMKYPMGYPDPIQRVTFTRFEGNLPEDAIISVEVTNNGKEGPRVKWEECTFEAMNRSVYQFQNMGQLYGWAFNFRISLRRGPSDTGGWLSRVSGYFDTPERQVPFSLEGVL